MSDGDCALGTKVSLVHQVKAKLRTRLSVFRSAHVSAVDFGRVAKDYSLYRAEFPLSFFDELATKGVVHPNLLAVDVGTGTGTIARGLTRQGCLVIGIDPSQALLDQARKLDRDAGLTIEYRVGTAEATGLTDDAVDVVSAGQCWHWFDRRAAAMEARRILRPGGAIVICYFDWLPLPGSVVEATEALILRHNARWPGAGGLGIHPEIAADISVAGFRGITTFSYDVEVPYSHEAWRGRIRASAGVAASLPDAAVTRFDHELAAMLREQFPSDALSIPHRVWALVATAPNTREVIG